MKAGTCIYFTGVSDEECEKGINYRSMAPGEYTGWVTRIPCMKRKGRSDTCDSYLEPTLAQILESEERSYKIVKGTTTAIKLIQDEVAATDPNMRNGVIECPVCKGGLHYNIADNGHIWGKCSTDNCLAWMM